MILYNFCKNDYCEVKEWKEPLKIDNWVQQQQEVADRQQAIAMEFELLKEKAKKNNINIQD